MTASAGFFGKIPARGDFVRQGLPSDLVRGLDDWWQSVLPASRARLGEAWTDIWMEAPIWRFTLPAGCCGSGAVAGLWLPSTDKAGRLFPLTIAITAPSWTELRQHGTFLDSAEDIGLTAVEQDVTPEQLGQAITQAAGGPAGTLDEPAIPTWWTHGSRLVGPARRTYPSMPNEAAFTEMLRDA